MIQGILWYGLPSDSDDESVSFLFILDDGHVWCRVMTYYPKYNKEEALSGHFLTKDYNSAIESLINTGEGQVICSEDKMVFVLLDYNKVKVEVTLGLDFQSTTSYIVQLDKIQI
jgi:hypothetical protein